MSIGGPTSGTLLIQRLDTALGNTVSQQSNIVSGARPDAVTQPDTPSRADPLQNENTRHPREAVDKAQSESGQQIRQAIDKTKIDARQAALLNARGLPNTASTPSAPTTLGNAAKTILALLMKFPSQSPVITGKAPLLGTQLTGPMPSTPQAGANPSTARLPTSAAGPTTADAAGARAPAGHSAGLAGAATSAPGSGPSSATSATFMQSLTQALQTSGVFYESHLNNLTFGKQSADSIRQEPQALLGRSTPTGNALPAADTSDANTLANNRAADTPVANNQSARADTNPASTTQQQSGTTSSPAQSSSLPGIHPETQLLVRQQLEVLANQTIAWRGEAWPDAPMEWEVRRENHSADSDQQEAPDHWATQLKINLPNLGEVHVRLNLAGQQIVMHLVAPTAAGLLSENGEALRAHFLNSGLQLSQLSIQAEPDDPSGPTNDN